MIDFIINDGGRYAAGFKGETGDCEARAIVNATGWDYQTVYDFIANEMAEAGFGKSANAYYLGARQMAKFRANGNKKTRGKPNARKVQDNILTKLGFTKVKLPKGPRPTYTEAHATYGNCVVTTRKHFCALANGALQDTFDGRTYEMVTPVCLTCDDGTGVQCGSGVDKCHSCGVETTVKLVNKTYERKAMSVWLPPAANQEVV